MDQKKTGCFLKELRKEKQLTQSQFAEQFCVSDRTVSRWENGSNMPDLSVLIEIADFYEVDIREIIDGERKGEKMKEAEREIIQKVADYTETEKKILLRRLRIISIVGFCSIVIGLVLLSGGLYHVMPVIDYVIGMSFGLAVGALLVAVLYSTGLLAKIRRCKQKKCQMKVITVICAIICVGLLIASIVVSI